MRQNRAMSKRINLTIPDSVYDALERWAAKEGRALANLAAFLVELQVKEALKRGDIPKDPELESEGSDRP